MKSAALACLLLQAAYSATAEPIPSGSILVIDGDTISTRGQTVRPVGFDTPEGGLNAGCEAERAWQPMRRPRCASSLPAVASIFRLSDALAQRETEGTPACNYGRSCGVLTAAGQDVAGLLIAEGLAKPYNCSRTPCPSPEPWC